MTYANDKIKNNGIDNLLLNTDRDNPCFESIKSLNKRPNKPFCYKNNDTCIFFFNYSNEYE